MKKILWFCWPLDYKNSGVGRYSDIYIGALKKKWIKIDDRWIRYHNFLLRIIYQFFLRPIQIIFSYRKEMKIFRDEWMLLYTLFPFFPYQNAIFIIHDIRDFWFSTKKKNFLEMIYFWLLKKGYQNIKKLEKIVTPSHFTKNKIIKTFWVRSDKVKVVYNPFDFTTFKVMKEIDKEAFLKKYWIRTDKKILLNVWSEESRKNIITILKTMNKIDDYVFIKIWKPIIQKNRADHLKFISDNTLRSKVYFIDFVETNEDLARFYNIADIFVFPSLFEGFGRPPIEAQACGCPVISSDRGGLKEVLWTSAIILKDPEDENELIKAIKSYSSEMKIIQQGFENIQRFDLSPNVEKWETILIK